MTDDTQPEAREFTMSQYASKDDMIGAMRKRIAELESELEAVGAGGVQALSAGPMVTSEQRRLIGVIAEKIEDGTLFQSGIYQKKDLARFVRNMLDVTPTAPAASPTPPAEQQATKETSGGFHVWRDISTAPKDGSRFVATGHNYGLYSEGRHICVAQWFRGCWMDTSDWNETSELKYLTHWMPLPSPPDDVAAPAEQQAAPKSAPGEQDDHQILAITTAYEQGVGKGHQAYNSGKEIANPYSPAYRCDLAWQYGYKEGKEQAQREAKPAPQQEAQEPAPSAAVFGLRLVPVEPTDQMVQAAHHIDLSYMPGQEGADRAAIYRAMIAAAPQQWNDLIGKETHADADGLLVWRDEVDFAIPTPPAEQQAAPKAAPGEPSDTDIDAFLDSPGGIEWVIADKRERYRLLVRAALAKWAAPQQEAQEPVATLHCNDIGYVWARATEVGTRMRFEQPINLYTAPQQEAQEPVAWLNPWRADQVTTDYDAYGERGIPLYTAPQPAPAPVSEMPYEKRKAIQEGEQISASDAWFHARHNMLDTLDRRNVFRAGFDRGWNAALAAQGGE